MIVLEMTPSKTPWPNESTRALASPWWVRIREDRPAAAILIAACASMVSDRSSASTLEPGGRPAARAIGIRAVPVPTSRISPPRHGPCAAGNRRRTAS